jgi:hypothetical protein
MTALSPVERDCLACKGCGYVHPAPAGLSWCLCTTCDGLGRTWIDGAPSFGQKMTLADRKPGEIVTLGNGDRGRILSRSRNGTPTTSIALICDFTNIESQESTSYPSSVGVISVADMRWFKDDDDHSHSREDAADPMRKRTP